MTNILPILPYDDRTKIHSYDILIQVFDLPSKGARLNFLPMHLVGCIRLLCPIPYYIIE